MLGEGGEEEEKAEEEEEEEDEERVAGCKEERFLICFLGFLREREREREREDAN